MRICYDLLFYTVFVYSWFVKLLRLPHLAKTGTALVPCLSICLLCLAYILTDLPRQNMSSCSILACGIHIQTDSQGGSTSVASVLVAA